MKINIGDIKVNLKCGINVILLIPFLMVLGTVFVINSELANPVVSGKYFWFYAWMAVSSLSIIAIYLINGRKVRWQLIDCLILLFGIISLVSSYIANQQINTKWILLTLCIVLYFYFRIVLSANKINRHILVLFLIITALAEVIWGLQQLYGFRISQHNLFLLTGSFFNPGPYAGYLAAVTPLVFYYLLADYKIFKSKFNFRLLWFYVRWSISSITILAIIMVLPASMSRASWLAAIGGCGLVAFVFFSRKYKLHTYVKQNRRRASIIVFSIIFCLIAAGSGMYFLKKDSADGRALMWKVSLHTIPSHPFGVGLNNFSGAYGEEQAAYFASGEGTEQEKYVAGSPEYAFNEYLQLCIELGIIPFLLFLTIIIRIIYMLSKMWSRYTFRRVSLSGLGVGVSLLSLLIFAFISYPFNVLPFVIILVLLLAACVSESSSKILKHSRTITAVLLPISCIIIGLCLYNRYPTHKAYKEWSTLKILYNMGHYQEAKKSYSEFYPYLNDQVNFMFEYGRTLRNAEQYEQSNRVLQEATRISCDPMFYNLMGQNYQSLKQYDAAEEAFIKAADIISNRHYPYYLLAKLYVETGEIAKAKRLAEYVIREKPKIPSPAIEEMKEEMKKIMISD
jgi:Lipid A core - O-antigen ligase and related enzymes